MINNWRDGLAGFVGGAKTLIKGVFQYSHTVTTEAVIITPKSFGVFSVIDADGQGLTSLIDATGQGVESDI